MSNQHTGRSKVRLNALAFMLVVEELMSGPCTAQALCDHTGLEKKTMWLLLRTMQDHNVVHIAAWEKDSLGRVGVKVYGFGAGRNAKKPTKTGAQACKDWRERRKAAALSEAFGVGA